MFNHKHYVPVLKAKQSELMALRRLDPQLKTHITPLLEIQPDTTNLSRVIGQIEKGWDWEQPLFMDAGSDLLQHDPAAAAKALDEVLIALRLQGFHVIPVTGLKRSKAYQDIVENAMSKDKQGKCIRIGSDDWDDCDSILAKMLKDSKLSAPDTDIVLDLGAFSPDQVDILAAAALSKINSLSKLGKWRTLTITGTSFPPSLVNIPPQIPTPIPRSELVLWQKIVNDTKTARKPAFGDYTIVHPKFPDDIDWSKVKIEAKIKYATSGTWLILRWNNTKGDWKKFYDVCNILSQQADYCGPDCCWGDMQVSLCSQHKISHGSPGTWVGIGINHHLTLVANQIASFP